MFISVERSDGEVDDMDGGPRREVEETHTSSLLASQF